MGELILVGLGLHSESDISLKGLETARSADEVYAEFYTGILPGLSLRRLEDLVGKPVKILKRRDLEDESSKLIERASTKKVAVLVPGDPLVATTHVDLILQARKRSIATRVVHSASIIGAISGATGLQAYKFGRTVSVPLASPTASSVYEGISANLGSGLHTLLLLEINTEQHAYLSVQECAKRLLEFEQKPGKGLIHRETLGVGTARLGGEDAKVKAGAISELASDDFGGPPHTLVLPSKLHFKEAEALEILAGAPRHLLRTHS